MKLLFVCTTQAARGSEVHTACLARACARAGHQVAVVAHPRGYLARSLSGSSVALVPGRFVNALDPWGIDGLVRAIRRHQPDFVIGGIGREYWPIALIAGLMTTPVVLFRHMHFRLPRADRWLLPYLVDRVVAVSGWLKQTLLDQGLPARKLELLYNPVDTAGPEQLLAWRAVTRARLGLTEGERLLGFVGAMDASKGVPMLAAALAPLMAENRSLHMLWLGDGAARAEVEAALPAALRCRHHFLGWRPDVLPHYAALDLLIAPSQWQETFGRVVAEAQACGVPVLASHIAGLPEALSGSGSGWLLPPADADAWRQAIQRFLSLPSAEVGEMRAAALAGARLRFAAEAIAEQFVGLLHKLLPQSAATDTPR